MIIKGEHKFQFCWQMIFRRFDMPFAILSSTKFETCQVPHLLSNDLASENVRCCLFVKLKSCNVNVFDVMAVRVCREFVCTCCVSKEKRKFWFNISITNFLVTISKNVKRQNCKIHNFNICLCVSFAECSWSTLPFSQNLNPFSQFYSGLK